MKSETLLEEAIDIIDKRGKSTLYEVSKQIIRCKYTDGIVSEALQYYARDILPRVLPIFPALFFISCEVAGEKPEKIKPLATAMMHITASGDIHDDIIDKSKYKFHRKTLFGKYGRGIALLAGDVLLIQGMNVIQNKCDFLSINQKKEIIKLITKTIFELSSAEATEIFLWQKEKVTSFEFFEMIRHKGCVAELHCRIGGIVADADEEILNNLTKYGRLIGILTTLKDEFLDLMNFSELKNRIKNEMLPYPIICAFENETIKKTIRPIIENNKFSKNEIKYIANMILNTPEVKNLKIELSELAEKELINNPLLKDSKAGKEATAILQALAFEM